MRTTLAASLVATLLVFATAAIAADITPVKPDDPIAGVPSSWRIDPSGTPLTDAELKKLAGGDVLSALIEVPDNPVKKGVAMGVVNAAPAKVLATCSDFEHFPDFMPYVAKIVVDKRDGHTAEVSYWLEFPLGIGNRNYQLDLVNDHKDVDGKKVYTSEWKYTGKGNIKDTSGSWDIAPYGDGTKSLVRYTVFTDPGGSIPNWAKNMAAGTAMTKVVKRVQERVGSKSAAAAVDY